MRLRLALQTSTLAALFSIEASARTQRRFYWRHLGLQGQAAASVAVGVVSRPRSSSSSIPLLLDSGDDTD